jgi:hypothetical protein
LAGSTKRFKIGFQDLAPRLTAFVQAELLLFLLLQQ